MTIYGDGKVTYTDAESLSGDLGEKVRGGDKEALQKLRKFAEILDPEQPHSQARALYELSEVYFKGLCDVEKSPEEALKFLIRAAELNDDLALIRLGKFYRDGEHFEINGKKALELFAKASDCGNKAGLILSAEIYRHGQADIAADGYKAVEFYEKLDAIDDKMALMNIAQIYATGCGQLKPDKYTALEIYNDIIRHGKYWAEVQRKFKITSNRKVIYDMALNCANQIYNKDMGGVKI